MTLVILSFVVVLVITAGGYFLLDSRMRRSDLDTIKSRLLGEAGSGKKGKPKTAAPALMQTEDARKNRLLLGLLRRFQVGHRLQKLLEQAGLRWPVARLARLMLLGLLFGFA